MQAYRYSCGKVAMRGTMCEMSEQLELSKEGAWVNSTHLLARDIELAHAAVLGEVGARADGTDDEGANEELRLDVGQRLVQSEHE